MKKYHHCVKFTYPLSFHTRIPKVDQHTGGKWLIHGIKHRKDNQLQSLELPYFLLPPWYLGIYDSRTDRPWPNMIPSWHAIIQ